LTYISINAAIKRHCRNERLFPVGMTDPSDQIKRGMYISREIKLLFEGPWIAKDGEERTARLWADLESYVKNQVVSVCLEPFTAGHAYFARLHEPEDEVWDIRSRTPAPAMRIFGRFAAPNTFIVFHWLPRSKPWNGREPLADRNDPRWEDAKTECQRQWKELFPKHVPIHGDKVHDYITENVHTY
jgi:hypothetical protein